MPVLFDRLQLSERVAPPDRDLSEPILSSAAIRANAPTVALQTEELSVPFTQNLVAKRSRAYQLPNGSIVWEGMIHPAPSAPITAPGGSLVILRNGNRLYANVRTPESVFQIRPTADGKHELVEFELNRLPPDGPPEDDTETLRRADSTQHGFAPAASAGVASRIGTADKPVFIRVMVNYTQAVLDQHPFINDFVDLLIAETNQGFFNSDVYIKLDLSAQKMVEYKESGKISTDLTRYRRTNDKHMDEIHAARDAGHADISVLLVDSKDLCGVARVNAKAQNAFAVVSHACASANYTFGHEIGHLFGARHDPATDPKKKPYAYGHGHRFEAGPWRTIMAYSCKNAECPRLNRWSNPHRLVRGQPTGNAFTSDNHRVLNERAAVVAAFRADSEPPR